MACSGGIVFGLAKNARRHFVFEFHLRAGTKKFYLEFLSIIRLWLYDY